MPTGHKLLGRTAAKGEVVRHYRVAPGARWISNYPDRRKLSQLRDYWCVARQGELIHHCSSKNQTVQAIRPEIIREVRKVGYVHDSRAGAAFT